MISYRTTQISKIPPAQRERRNIKDNALIWPLKTSLSQFSIGTFYLDQSKSQIWSLTIERCVNCAWEERSSWSNSVRSWEVSPYVTQHSIILDRQSSAYGLRSNTDTVNYVFRSLFNQGLTQCWQCSQWRRSGKLHQKLGFSVFEGKNCFDSNLRDDLTVFHLFTGCA